MSEVAKKAAEWVGRPFARGQKAQCANFVRHVFRAAGNPLKLAQNPSDKHLLSPGAYFGPSMANSLAGDEIGEKVAREQVQPGDVLLFANTYGDWPAGVITHVGIAENRDSMIHRPTASRPVERVSLVGYWESKFAEARRPKRQAGERVWLWVNENGATMKVNGELRPVAKLTLEIELE